MSQSLPERIDMRQLRRQAKELTRALNHGDADAASLAREFDPGLDAKAAKLADAQRLLARRYGFESWSRLVLKVDLPDLQSKLLSLVQSGDADGLDRLLSRSPLLRRHIDDPIFSFDAPAIVHGSHMPNAQEVVSVLVKHGADPNARSKWWAGGFGALDHASDRVAETLVSLGARWDPCSAAKHGRLDILESLLKEDPVAANFAGGDGMRPLHFAAHAATVDLLVRYGADLNIKDVDHEGTPVQHQARNPEVLRALVGHGAKPDVFTAAILDDPGLMERILRDNPSAADARVGAAPFVTDSSDGGHIYLYTIGEGKTPQILAEELGNRRALEVLARVSRLERMLTAAAWAGDARRVDELLAAHPGLGARLTPEDASALPAAAMKGRVETISMLLAAGVDPMTRGMGQGTGLHIACWFGYVECVRAFLGHVSLEDRDPEHGGTPLSWAAHGALWCRNPSGDYVGVVKLLLEAGADPTEPANRNGTPLMEQAGNREDVKDALRAALT